MKQHLLFVGLIVCSAQSFAHNHPSTEIVQGYSTNYVQKPDLQPLQQQLVNLQNQMAFQHGNNQSLIGWQYKEISEQKTLIEQLKNRLARAKMGGRVSFVLNLALAGVVAADYYGHSPFHKNSESNNSSIQSQSSSQPESK